jgi:hypothetical protein
VLAGRGVDAHDPQLAEFAFLGLAVAVGVGQGPFHGLARGFVQLAAGTDVALGQLQVFGMPLVGGLPSFDAHGVFSFGRTAGAGSAVVSSCGAMRPIPAVLAVSARRAGGEGLWGRARDRSMGRAATAFAAAAGMVRSGRTGPAASWRPRHPEAGIMRTPR